ncbi:MAG: class I SAM-dependent methyltransferase, partial [Ignavibacteria bacterium]|nr:class I SAM-dependent methyltransferase [Ignavibacteria bacterium]
VLKLENIRTTHTRVETLKDKYHFITCRAVAPLIEIFQWTKYLITPNPDSYWLILKGGDLHEEINTLGKRLEMIKISDYFEEEYFREKYVLKLKR